MNWQSVRHVLFMVALALFASAAVLAACSDASGEGATEQELPITASSSGFQVSLTSVTVSEDETLLNFEVKDEQPETPPELVGFDGMIPELDMELTGLSFSKDEFIGELSAVRDETSSEEPKPVVAFNQEVVLGPVDEPAEPVTVTINELRFSSDDPSEGSQPVAGTWEFTFTPENVLPDDSTIVEIQVSDAADDITFVVESLRISNTEAIVTYRIDSQRPGRIEKTGIVARVSDGEYVYPTRTENNGSQHIAHFKPFPSGDKVDFILPALLAEVPEPVSIPIPISGPINGTLPVDASVSIMDERLAVTEIQTASKDAVSKVAIRVENEAQEKTGRVLLRMPGASVTLTDNLGNTYETAGAGTNLEKSSPVDMWAGGSSFSFQGEIPAEATVLTLQVDSYALVLGPWSVTVQGPASG